MGCVKSHDPRPQQLHMAGGYESNARLDADKSRSDGGPAKTLFGLYGYLEVIDMQGFDLNGIDAAGGSGQGVVIVGPNGGRLSGRRT